MTDGEVRHLSREVALIREDVTTTLAMVRDEVKPALSHIADRGVRNELRIAALEAVQPFESPRRAPLIPWRLFAVAVSSAALALAGAHLLNL